MNQTGLMNFKKGILLNSGSGAKRPFARCIFTDMPKKKIEIETRGPSHSTRLFSLQNRAKISKFFKCNLKAHSWKVFLVWRRSKNCHSYRRLQLLASSHISTAFQTMPTPSKHYQLGSSKIYLLS